MGEQKSKGNSPDRSTLWAFLIYPGDSAPEDWLEKLKSERIRMFISPLHVPDEEEKKQHRHVMIFFDSLKSEKQANEISELVNGTHAFIVKSQSGYGRYLTHLDDPDKQQWSEEQLKADPVIGLCGLSYPDKLLEWASNNDGLAAEIEKWIDENDIFSFWRLKNWCRDNNEVWYRYLNRRSIAIDLYIKSKLWTATKENEALFAYRAAKEKSKQAESVSDDEDLLACE